jgi:hypothetical protein
MPSLPPGFSESETLRQSRGDSWRPGPRLGGVRVLFELFELRLGLGQFVPQAVYF